MPIHGPSPYAGEALRLLGKLIRAGRTERGLTAAELAERAGFSRALLYRIENGDPSCSIGAVFEAAAVVGVSLFEAEPSRLALRGVEADSRLALLPKAVHKPKVALHDDF